MLAREDAGGVCRLIAYLVADTDAGAGAAPAPDALRTALAAGLPDYMVPAAFVRLDAWPLSPSGKIDRAALPAPGDADLAVRAAHVAPCTPMEEVLAGIWSELLGVERIGVHDNFFELGGHSLMAMRLLAMLQELFAIAVSPGAFFEAPTVAALSRRLLPDEPVDEDVFAPESSFST